MSLVFGRYKAVSGVRAPTSTERGSKPGQPSTHGINLGVEKRNQPQGPSIAELCSVASRVARETLSYGFISYLLSFISAGYAQSAWQSVRPNMGSYKDR